MYIPFESMPESSRVWLYQSERKFRPEEQSFIAEKLSKFCEGWNVHGNPLPTSFEVLDEQIIVLAVDESQAGASGCSIDSSVRTLREIESQLQVDLTNSGKVSFKSSAGSIVVTPALGIKSKVLAGDIQEETPIINPMIQIKADLPNIWISAGNSWLNKFFPN
ncbi:hypothetical protein [Algoriphagus zhangzhouensis]|uniref:ABC transporter ATPase n=1 Tax=Algoriphagus zhangzhouensis TaxID=1073327 RepID=A0A1M7ZFX0_9BACT|nr:hypothetical protein [Algoriphagus zhangzhouensis]TDY44894.1 hypothetical protein A8938_3107 [Algoriphagus zhangzhouensis]SHO63815.1 hypothetical protein SAMN04488108_2979 [Algoriphagus zhangzhouensis]